MTALIHRSEERVWRRLYMAAEPVSWSWPLVKAMFSIVWLRVRWGGVRAWSSLRVEARRLSVLGWAEPSSMLERSCRISCFRRIVFCESARRIALERAKESLRISFLHSSHTLHGSSGVSSFGGKCRSIHSWRRWMEVGSSKILWLRRGRSHPGSPWAISRLSSRPVWSGGPGRVSLWGRKVWLVV